MYTVEMLKEMNRSYDREHGVTDGDVAWVNEYVRFIEATRSDTQPKVGDRVRHTTKYGDYYPHAQIVHNGNRYGGNVCEAGSSYIWINDEGNDIATSTSGGPFIDIDTSKMKYVGKELNTFWFFGHCGATANGGVYFQAEVNVWEYIDEELEDRVHTTKDYDRYYIQKIDHRKERYSIYNYRVSKGGGGGYGYAFETEEDLNAWKKTFRVEETDMVTWGGSMVWAWKQKRHGISPDEFESMTEPEDTFLMNGSIRRCKRKYDEENHTVHTYHVWYWGDDWMENSAEQNRVIDSYSLDRTHKEYELARKSA